jgi:ABC-type transport system involved in multi-copper enzyme maturation permease subunit
MAVLPIIERELRLGSRKPRTYLTRAAFALMASLTTLGILSPVISGFASVTVMGPPLFNVLSIAGFACCLMAGPFVSSDALSQERRDGSLEALALTRLSGWDLVRGKLLALSLNPVYCAVSALPLLALSVVLGGVTGGEFWRMAAVWLNTLFFSMAVGLCCSAVAWHNFRSFTAASALLIICGGLVPGSSAYFAYAKHYGSAPGRFWVLLLLTNAMAWFFLHGAASKVFDFTRWEEPVPDVPPRRWLARFLRRPDVGRSVGENPVMWWENRQLYRWLSVWGFLLLAGIAWAICYVQYRRLWVQAEMIFLATSILHMTLKGWMAIEATRKLGEARRRGELELLLVTPLGANTIVDARMRALQKQFLIPIALVLMVDILFLLFGMQTTAWWGNPGSLAMALLVGIGVFVCDCYTITWVGLWQGLSGGTAVQSFLRTLLLVLARPWLVYMVTVALAGAAMGAGLWAIAWWFLICIVNCFWLCHSSSRNLETRFRLAASTA